MSILPALPRLVTFSPGCQMDSSDEPIDPTPDSQPRVAEVIDLDGVRIQWGLPRGPWLSRCKHQNLTYSSEEHRVWCQDCKRTIENFDAFMVLVNRFQRMEADARSKIAKANEAMAATVIRRAAKAVDKAWMGDRAIGCPHCQGGILADDFANGTVLMSREYELARRNRQRNT